MTLYDRILVPTDGSPEGKRAVAHAIDLAAVHDATVTTVYVINTASYNGVPMESSWQSVSTVLTSDAQAALDEVVDLGADRGVPVETEITDGSPSSEIVRLSERADCDLIVMGTHGRGGISRLLLGSVAEHVVRDASVPVLTVNVGAEPAELSEPATAHIDAESTVEADSPSG